VSPPSSVAAPPALLTLVDACLEPAPEDRPTAAGALAALDGREERGAGAPLARLAPPSPPPGALSRLALAGRTLTIDCPPEPLLTGDRAGAAAFALVWNGTIAAWTATALAAGALGAALFSLPFWIAGAAVTKDALGGSMAADTLSVGPKAWRLESRAALGRFARAGRGDPPAAAGDTADLRGARVAVVAVVNGVPRTRVELIHGFQTLTLAEGVPPDEQAWLAATINAHIEAVTGKPVDVPPARELPPPPPGWGGGGGGQYGGGGLDRRGLRGGFGGFDPLDPWW